MTGFLRSAFQQRSALDAPPEWLMKYLGGGMVSESGEVISIEGSLKIPAVLAGFSILMEDIASLPLILYHRLTRGKERAVDHPYYFLMHDQPNPEMTSMVFRELIVGHMLGWGNFYGQMLWDGAGVVRQIWPLNPANMEVGRKDGERIYLYRNQQGKQIAFRQDEILHIPAFGFDGLKGYSRITLARNSIGLAVSAEKYSSRIFANDARPGIVLKHPGTLKEDAYKRLVESWSQTYGGAGNAGKTAIVEEGIDISTIGFPPKDALFIESQKWSVAQIARVFRIPPHMLGDVERSTSWGTGIEQQELGYLTHTLRPWMVRTEQQLNKDLLLTDDRREHFFEHLVDAMLRTDLDTRMRAYATAITNGVYTRNEVREKENLLPYEGGDEPLYPLNLSKSSDPAQDDEPPPPQPKRDLTPLLLDALRRIAKRDENELQGALKRFVEKEDKFNKWVEQFYKRDYPEFILVTFQPLIDSGFIEPDQIKRFIEQITTRRGNDIETANYENLEPANLLTLLQEVQHA
jgi:HK97 family phage portal protein